MSATAFEGDGRSGRPLGRARRLIVQATIGAVAAAIVGLAGVPVEAQPARPQATLRALPASALRPGGAATLRLRVELPDGVHVQAHEPRDPLLVPTVATLEAPPGLSIGTVVYPPPSEVRTGGAAEPLLVLGPAFEVEVQVQVSASAAAGALDLPVVLRYQACNDTTCFPPARAHASWPLVVRAR